MLSYLVDGHVVDVTKIYLEFFTTSLYFFFSRFIVVVVLFPQTLCFLRAPYAVELEVDV